MDRLAGERHRPLACIKSQVMAAAASEDGDGIGQTHRCHFGLAIERHISKTAAPLGTVDLFINEHM